MAKLITSGIVGLNFLLVIVNYRKGASMVQHMMLPSYFYFLLYSSPLKIRGRAILM